MYACPNCGSNIKFDPATQKMKCSYCDTLISPHDKMFARGAEEQKGIDLDSDEYEVTYYTCPQCGGELITEDTTAATFCSYCGSSTILEMRVGKEKKPDYIIPFKKTREDCERAYKSTVRRALFAPNWLKKDETVERFRGIYMPYWIYDVRRSGALNTKGQTSKRRGDYIYTSHFAVDSQVDIDYSGLSYDASSSFEDRLSDAIAPFDLKESDNFTSSYLSGFYADTSDVSAEVYEREARELALDDAARAIAAGQSYTKHGVTGNEVAEKLEKNGVNISHKLGMFPVWFLSSNIGDRVIYAVVNGQTGKVAMDLPIDIWKYFLGCLIGAIPSYFLFAYSGILIGPRLLICLAMIISLVVLILANKQANALFAREIMFADKGFNSKKTPEQVRETRKMLDGRVIAKKPQVKVRSGAGGWAAAFGYATLVFAIGSYFAPGFAFLAALAVFVVAGAVSVSKHQTVKVVRGKVIVKAPAKKKIGMTIFPIITMAIGGLVILIHPFEDMYYYGTAIIGMIMTGFTVVRLVMTHNKLTSRKLPQFNKRGGEEHENDD